MHDAAADVSCVRSSGRRKGRSGASLYGTYSAEDEEDEKDDNFRIVSSRTYGSGVFVSAIVRNEEGRKGPSESGRVKHDHDSGLRVPCSVSFDTVMTSRLVCVVVCGYCVVPVTI